MIDSSVGVSSAWQSSDSGPVVVKWTMRVR